jgi:hypothetical protein
MKNVLFAGVASVLLAGCTSAFQLKDDAPAPSNDESVVILGVSDEHYQVSIFPGSIDKGVFVTTLIRPATVAGKSRNGYLVGKARANDIIAITLVRYKDNPDAILGFMDFVPCNGSNTMVFRVPHGKVVYLGSVDYRFNGRNLNIRYTNELEQAQRYIDSSFPALRGKVEHIAPEFMPMKASCNSTVYIPVYVSR